jgi:hypothetical protein
MRHSENEAASIRGRFRHPRKQRRCHAVRHFVAAASTEYHVASRRTNLAAKCLSKYTSSTGFTLQQVETSIDVIACIVACSECSKRSCSSRTVDRAATSRACPVDANAITVSIAAFVTPHASA